MINWKVRFKNKNFWLALIPALLLFAKTILTFCNIEINFDFIQEKILELIEIVFVILALLGIVTDPTTAGISDSERAMHYFEPYKDERK